MSFPIFLLIPFACAFSFHYFSHHHCVYYFIHFHDNVLCIFLYIQIIAMENNAVRAKGAYRDIENIDGDLIKEWNSIIVKENAIDELSRFLFNYSEFFVIELVKIESRKLN